MTKVYDFTVPAPGGPQQLWDFHGKVLLIVHLGRDHARTQQLEGVDRLAQAFAAQGLQVIGFPYLPVGEGRGAPTAASLEVSFPVMGPIPEDGTGAAALFAWLSTEAPGVFGTTAVSGYTKFLIGRDGAVIRRFAATDDAATLIAAVRMALSAPVPQVPPRPTPAPTPAGTAVHSVPPEQPTVAPAPVSEVDLAAAAAADAVERDLRRNDPGDDLMDIAADIEALSQETAMTERYFAEERQARVNEQVSAATAERHEHPESNA